MKSTQREKGLIFREKAHRLYLQNQQKIVVLKLARPKLFPVFWALLGGLALLTAFIWNTEVPVTLGGVGLVIEQENSERPILVSLLPADSLPQLQAGQRVVAYDKRSWETPLLNARLQRVDNAVMSPKAIYQRFELDHLGVGLIDGPTVVAIAQIDTEPSGLDWSTYVGSNLPIQVEVESRPVLSLIPGIRVFF